MHENEFEKQVQQKMEELNFVPSDAVWQNVDKEINKKEKRRTLFWIFLFTGLMLAGAGYFFTVNNNTHKIVADNQQAKTNEKQEKKNKQLSEENKNDNASITNDDKIADGKIRKEKHLNDNVNKSKSETNRNEKEIIEEHIVLSEKKINNNKKANAPSFLKTKNGSAVGNKQKNNNEAEEKLNIPDQDKITVENNKSNNEIRENIPSQELKKNEHDSATGESPEVLTENKTEKKDSAGDKAIENIISKLKKPFPWKIGVMVAPGISNVQQNLFKETNVYNAPAYLTSGSVSNPNGSYYYASSEIKKNFSIAAGLSFSNQISKRILLSIGIDYHYYSTKIFVGNVVDSFINLYPSQSFSVQANGYYRNGNTKAYINHYHLAELPFALNFQLNKNMKHPLFWDAGFSILYLMNTNALHFDPTRNVYYKDSRQFNKMQLHASSELMLGFPFGKSQLLVGPQLQYGLTGLLKKNTGNSQHLFFSGVKVSYTFSKK